MFFIYISEIPSLLNLNPFQTQKQTIGNIVNRYFTSSTKNLREAPWPTQLYVPLPDKVNENGKIMTSTQQIVKGLWIRGRAELTEDSEPVVTRKRTKMKALHIFKHEYELCVWYAWLFGCDYCIYDIHFNDENKTIIERKIEKNIGHIQKSLSELVKVLNNYLMPHEVENLISSEEEEEIVVNLVV